jgi:hypothetical protein
MRRFNIPNRWCTVDDLKARRAGHTTHNDLRLAFGGTTHTDPGAGFPRDHVIEIVAAELEGDDMANGFNDADRGALTEVYQNAVPLMRGDNVVPPGGGQPGGEPHWGVGQIRAITAGVAELVARPADPTTIDPAELVAAMAASEEFMLALGAAIAAALPGNQALGGTWTVTQAP